MSAVSFTIDASVLSALGAQADRRGITVSDLLSDIAEQLQQRSDRGRRDTLLEKIVRLYAAGWSDSRIAEAVSCSPSTVRNKRVQLGLPAHPRPKQYRRKAA